jgi:hypothetical protein
MNCCFGRLVATEVSLETAERLKPLEREFLPLTAEALRRREKKLRVSATQR